MANRQLSLGPFILLLLFIVFIITSLSSKANAAVTHNILAYGAEADGETDSTEAFLAAWSQSCASASPSTIYVPPGRFFLRNVALEGPCNNNAILVRIDGTLVAPSAYWDPDYHPHDWIVFRRVNGVTLSGGILDGQGTSLWSCKKASAAGRNCPTGATTLVFVDSVNIVVSGLTSANSQLNHIVIFGCRNVRVQGVRISADGNSPNTDGIHLQSSTGITIYNSWIGTGDDCISVGPGTTNIWIENVACGPGHGISIGSLGKTTQEAGVENVTVSMITFRGTLNGVRIKTWGRPSNGFARNILFQNILMSNVQNPIIIDQNYCPDKSCLGQASGVKISDVTYSGVRGTSATQVAVKFDCSDVYPCTRLTLNDVLLTYENGPAGASCNNAGGTASAVVSPTSCL